MELHFTKMEGIGNDYIYIDGIHQHVPLDKEFITKVSDRHFGIGGDGIIVILESEKYDFKMRMFNLDDGRKQLARYNIKSNNIPKICLGFLTPNEMFNKYLGVM